MKTQHITVRLPEDLVKFLENYADKLERSRNYVIKKFLTEKKYELTGEC